MEGLRTRNKTEKKLSFIFYRPVLLTCEILPATPDFYKIFYPVLSCSWALLCPIIWGLIISCNLKRERFKSSYIK